VEQRRWFSVRQLVLACLVGLIVGYGAFLLTAVSPDEKVISMCDPVLDAGFDPLTGMPHGTTLNCPQLHLDGTQTSVTQVVPMSADLASRRAIPVPLGFVVGAGSVLLVSTVSRARRRSD
jgi:hypothetical protein